MSRRKTLEEVLNDFKSLHGDKYDYSLITEYINKHQKLPIICKEHGIFEQSYAKHFKCGHGCPKCGNPIRTTEYYIDKARSIHGDKYDYSKTIVENYKKKSIIICHKKDSFGNEHGEFLMSMDNHCHKTKPQGCPKCKESKLECEINNFFINNNIQFERQKRFEWLGYQSLDFYLPEYNIAIECQGEQHFKTHSGSFFTFEKVEEIKKLDERKKQLCEENGIKLLYYSNLGIDYPYYVFEDKNELLNALLQ